MAAKRWVYDGRFYNNFKFKVEDNLWHVDSLERCKDVIPDLIHGATYEIELKPDKDGDDDRIVACKPVKYTFEHAKDAQARLPPPLDFDALFTATRAALALNTVKEQHTSFTYNTRTLSEESKRLLTRLLRDSGYGVTFESTGVCVYVL
jgi:hypothetical protein